MARRQNPEQDQRGRMRIRSRLALLLIVPLVGLLAVTGLQVYNAIGQARDASELSSAADVSLASYRLVDALQAERQLLAGDQSVTEESRAAVDAASNDLRSTAAAHGGTLEALTQRALGRVEAAGTLAKTDTGGMVAVDGYSPAIDDLLLVSRQGFDPGGAIDDRPATTADFLATAQEAGAHERDLITALAADGALVTENYQRVTSLASEQEILSAEASEVADTELGVRIDRIGDALAGAALGRDQLFFTQVEPAAVQAWLDGASARVSQLQTLRDTAADEAVAAVDALGTQSTRTLLLSGLAVFATLLISGLLVRSATRSIARPLQDLAAQAEEVALSRLPEAVRAQQESSDEVHLPALRATGAAEVREVAGAFNDVQDTALRLAGEQAVLRRNLGEALTNLGRRNQALLGRQLDFISSLEKRETDPAFLDHLFRLDHLASRMRRNAESLLILAGSETPRRRRKPAPMAEAVRAAMSEVEDFERVRLGQLGQATLAGPVVIDLVHLLAELIENALGFSPPDTTVEIDGRSLGQGGYQLAVIDHGVGMSDVELVAANQRLAGLDEVDGMPTRYLGQYVIAKLASKTGALVRLQPTAGGRGVTAVVTLPGTAMIGGADRSGVAQPLPGTRAARDQGPTPFAPGAGIAAPVPQPEPVIDPTADPFAEPVPATDELAVPVVDLQAAAATEDWSWTPEVPTLDDAPPSYEPPVEAPSSDLPFTDQPFTDQPFTDRPDADPTSAEQPAEVPSFDGQPFDERLDDEFGAVIAGAMFGDEPTIPAAPADGGWDPHDGSWTPAAGDATPAVDDVPLAPLDDRSWNPDGHPAAAAPSEMEVAPPPPPSVDVPQQDWATDVPDAPAPEGGSTPPPAPTWEAAPAAFASAPEVPSPPAPEPAPATAPAGSAGGLTRRVPGASLSESPLGASAPAPEPAHDRSADGVRSMLSSFQTGRHRGRAGADAHDEAAPVGVDTLDPAVTQHTGAQAPELEDPRDH